MNKLAILFVLIFFQTGCLVHRVTKPIEKVALPKLDSNKGRIFIYDNGFSDGFSGVAQEGKIMDVKSNTILVKLLGSQCTYMDVEPGTYTLRVETALWHQTNLETDVKVVAGSVNYLMQTYREGILSGIFSQGKGSHLMQLIPEVGKKVMVGCNYIPSKKLPVVLEN